jgi:acetyltransferase
MVTIEQLDLSHAQQDLPHLVELLCDTVASGASVGFLPPLSPDEAEAYWKGVLADLAQGYVLLWAAYHGSRIVGSVQLQPSPKANGSHRAEVAKLMVHTAHRRQGIGRKLMQALEAEALAQGRTTLILDTRQNDPSEKLYLSLGYTRAGVIPAYARSADGALHSTVLFYKLLKGER